MTLIGGFYAKNIKNYNRGMQRYMNGCVCGKDPSQILYDQGKSWLRVEWKHIDGLECIMDRLCMVNGRASPSLEHECVSWSKEKQTFQS